MRAAADISGTAHAKVCISPAVVSYHADFCLHCRRCASRTLASLKR
jgi:hypothetical protein